MNETLHRILTAAAALEIKFGKDAYNAGSISRELNWEITAQEIMAATKANGRLISEGKKSGCYTLTAAGRAALEAPVTTAVAAPVAPAAPVLGYARTDNRRLIDSSKALPVGTVFTYEGQRQIVTAHSENAWYLSHNRIEAEGLWDLADCAVTYEYYRRAPISETPSEEVASEVVVVAETESATPELGATEAAEQIIRISNGWEDAEVSAEQGQLLYARTGGQVGESRPRLYLLADGRLLVTRTLGGYGDSLGPSTTCHVCAASAVPPRLMAALGVIL